MRSDALFGMTNLGRPGVLNLARAQSARTSGLFELVAFAVGDGHDLDDGANLTGSVDAVMAEVDRARAAADLDRRAAVSPRGVRRKGRRRRLSGRACRPFADGYPDVTSPHAWRPVQPTGGDLGSDQGRGRSSAVVVQITSPQTRRCRTRSASRGRSRGRPWFLRHHRLRCGATSPGCMGSRLICAFLPSFSSRTSM